MLFFRYARKSIALAAILSLFLGCSESNEDSGENSDSVALPDTLVTAEWLSQHLNDPDLVILDCTVSVVPDEELGFRIVNGREDFEKGHIPTAGFADLMGNLSDGASELRFAVPTPEQFAAAMSELGVGDGSKVVLYDANGNGWAARVWWMLRWIGFDQAALLDGGLDAWVATGRSLSTEPATPAKRELTVNLRPDLIVDQDEVRASLYDGEINFIDALSPAQYRGDVSMYGRPGHIPGASNVPAMSLLNDSGEYRPKDELAALFDDSLDARSINYCGGGIAASSTAFVMTRLGFTDVAVYTASLQEWVADPSNPLETSLETEPAIE